MDKSNISASEIIKAFSNNDTGTILKNIDNARDSLVTSFRRKDWSEFVERVRDCCNAFRFPITETACNDDGMSYLIGVINGYLQFAEEVCISDEIIVARLIDKHQQVLSESSYYYEILCYLYINMHKTNTISKISDDIGLSLESTRTFLNILINMEFITHWCPYGEVFYEIDMYGIRYLRFKGMHDFQKMCEKFL